jgi:hypothetical protein
MVLITTAIATVAQEQGGVLLPVREHGKWGFIDKTGQMRISPQFDDAIDISNTFDSDLEPVEKDGKWGFINRDGTWAIEPSFYLATKLNGDAAAVETDSGWVFITRSGQYLRTPEFERVTAFGDKYYAVVRQVGDGWTYFDPSAGLFLPINQDIPEGVSEGLLPLSEYGKWGYVNESGAFVIQPTFDGARGFSESLADSNEFGAFCVVPTCPEKCAILNSQVVLL